MKEKLSSMTVKNRSYIYVTDQIGNYIQTGGYGDSFTVEKRVYVTPTTYTHCKAGYRDIEHTNGLGEVMISGNHVKLKRNQILSQSTVELLLLDFFQGTETVDTIEWVEMDI